MSAPALPHRGPPAPRGTWARTALAAAGASGLVAVGLWGAVHRPLLTLALCAGAALAAFLLRLVPQAIGHVRRLENPALAVLLLASALLFTREEGYQWYELAAGAYFYGYLVVWIFSRATTAYPLVEHWTEVALLFFVAWSVLSSTWGLLNTIPAEVIGETRSMVTLLAYFPVREQARREGGDRWILGAIVALTLFIAVRNLLDYRSLVVNAVMAWQQSKARVVTNEVILLLGSLVTLAWLGQPMRRLTRVLSVSAFFVLFASLVLTQSRAFWVDFALGALVLMVLVRGRARTRMLSTAVAGSVLLGVAALMAMGPAFVFASTGLLMRASSLNTSVLSDISLMTRFYEARTVLALVMQNPVVGYGLGARYSFYDLIDDVTLTRAFVHNGYVMMLFKVGVVGALPSLAGWMGWIVRGTGEALRSQRWDVRAATAVLVSLLPSASTAHHFYSGDTALVYALAGGWLMGAIGAARSGSVLPLTSACTAA